MKIALVRGAFLNPYELQLYAPLTDRQEVLAIGADWQIYRYPLEWKGRMERARVQGGFMQALSPRAPLIFNRMSSWLSGKSFGLSGLESLVGGQDILHAAETFFTMTYQCLELKRKERLQARRHGV